MQDKERLDLLIILGDLLVQEFRTWQVVLTLTHDERRALASHEPVALSALAEDKEALLDELSRAEDKRRSIVQKLSGKDGCPGTSSSLARLEQTIPARASQRLNRLREGILALSSKIEALTCGNQRLILQALERIEPQGSEPGHQRAIYQSTLEVGQRAIAALNLFDMLS